MNVVKTVKLFIDGAFVRSESGHTFVCNQGSGLRLCQASRKDLRNAVQAARSGFGIWSQQTAYLRGQILYRMAEMLQSRPGEWAEVLPDREQWQQGVDRLVYYAGFSDKYQQLLGCTNPVSGPFFHSTRVESRGVQAVIATGLQVDLPGLLDAMAAALAAGNSLVLVLTGAQSALIGPLSEVVATADIPPGVVNLLSTSKDEWAEVLGGHHEVRGLCLLGSQRRLEPEVAELWPKIHEWGADHLKRLTLTPPQQCLEAITPYLEYKSLWQPVGY